MPSAVPTKSHFTVLSLPEPSLSSPPPSPSEVKAAYKSALLRHHPDKTPSVGRQYASPTPTIDEITLAYRTLSSSVERDIYMKGLLAQRKRDASTSTPGLTPHDGNEAIDLEKMQYDPQERSYYRACRCGRARGYTVTEAELEEHAGLGEVSIGCEGCSLIIRVEFEAVEDAES